MIPLLLSAEAEADAPFVTRLRAIGTSMHSADAILVESDALGATFAGKSGLFAIDGATADDLDGDIVLVRPQAGRLERLLRSGSTHNTMLVTERCDQLCVMCSQPPKKTHDDRFDLLEQGCLLAEPDTLIGISGGEPTLYKDQLLGMVERVLTARPDLSFHILTNAQHFDADDISRLRASLYRQVSWGIPLYAAEPALHDEIVGKRGAFAQLEDGFAHLIMAGARVDCGLCWSRPIITHCRTLRAMSRCACNSLRHGQSCNWRISASLKGAGRTSMSIIARTSGQSGWR